MDLGRPAISDEIGPSRFAASVMGQEESLLTREFFGKRNMNVLQASMAEAAVHATGLQLSRQNEASLLIIMKGIFAEKATHNAEDVEGQVAALNEQVLGVCVPQVLSGIGGYLAYLKNISSMPVPLARGQNSSSVGTKLSPSMPGL